jgi:hypothetical protein
MDNTEVFRVMADALGLGAANAGGAQRTEIAPARP